MYDSLGPSPTIAILKYNRENDVLAQIPIYLLHLSPSSTIIDISFYNQNTLAVLSTSQGTTIQLSIYPSIHLSIIYRLDVSYMFDLFSLHTTIDGKQVQSNLSLYDIGSSQPPLSIKTNQIQQFLQTITPSEEIAVTPPSKSCTLPNCKSLSLALSGPRGIASVYVHPKKLLLFDLEGEEEEEEEEEQQEEGEETTDENPTQQDQDQEGKEEEE